jgi:hypothetical protein
MKKRPRSIDKAEGENKKTKREEAETARSKAR